LIDRLPSDHPWAGVDPNDLSTDAVKPIEQEVLQAAGREAEAPSQENLPRDDSMIERVRTDPESGSRTVSFYGRKSFIADLSRPARRVRRICNPDTMQVLWGQPFSRLPGA
jgi:hypothetical protein